MYNCVAFIAPAFIFTKKDIRMRHLQSFKYVKLISEIGSIRGAAESCAISPSALNRHIQSLELDIGIQIFDRLSVGVRLSTEGELFYQFALLQLRSFERLQSQINDLKGLQTGIVRLGISAELNGIFINNQIAEFQNEYPQIAFQIKIIDQNIMENDLISNQIDLGFFYQPIVTKYLSIIHAFEIKVHAAIPTELYLNNLNRIKFYDLIDQEVLLPLKNTHLRNKIDGVCAKLGVNFNTQLESNDPLLCLKSSKRKMVSFCLPFESESHEYNEAGYKLLPLAQKELGVGYVNFVTSTQGIMGVATQRFFKKCVKSLEKIN
ncbi:LysR family transcriptional regulator [Amylibacter sp.]|jgi:DNA-binding transcriptional LysR family regulator|nr:LysR family transcriptional regulator [Amylibacter sp.]MDA8853052.1 LysR family transcriptional regulator [Amylibacter sp.]MDA9074948.1 LysR family transcriptional regulator [Amylibacter sp.]MDB0014833.1 LysR family transcriptional regulator [Amylibacter sp.]MDB4100410.1 LysR family transcriptional regulator [Amylibacter sp.]|tara:strand:- start:113 stop:1072 length:960 start_codon:yes stop_codon:yes gene_type:complete